MKYSSTEQLLKFITEYNLRCGRLIIFNAVISYYKKCPLIQLRSEVQVITLPDELALYITEFYKEEYQVAEMYNTAAFDFRYSSGNALEIWDNTNLTNPLLSILPVAESE